MKVYSGNPNRIRKTAHHMPRKTVKKKPYLCKDGPYKDQLLWLTDGTTMVFCANNQNGRYVNGQWQSC